MKKRVWHVDLICGLLMAGIILAAYVFDGPKNPSNAIKPTVTQEQHQLLCLDGGKPIDWRCPDETRL